MRGRKRRRGRGGTGGVHRSFQHQDHRYENDSEDNEIFMAVKVTLSKSIIDRITGDVVLAIQDLLKDSPVNVISDEQGISLNGSWEDVAAARKQLKNARLKVDETDDRKSGSIVSKSQSKKEVDTPMENPSPTKKAPKSRSSKGLVTPKKEILEDIFPKTPIAPPIKTYGKVNKGAATSVAVSRRSNRLSSKPRLSFAKLAKVGIKQESDEEFDDSEDCETTDDFPATVEDTTERTHAYIKNDPDALQNTKVMILSPHASGNADQNETSPHSIDNTQQQVTSSTIIVVKNSREKEEGQIDYKQSDDTVVKSEAVDPTIKILDVMDGDAELSTDPDDKPYYPRSQPDSYRYKRGARRRPGTRRKVPPAASTVCPMCGYHSKSVLGMKSHLLNYHNPTEYECDICFKRFGQKNQKVKHRSFHFDGDGSLKESAILTHISALERDGREENLDLDLLRYVNAYREKMDSSKVSKNVDSREKDSRAADPGSLSAEADGSENAGSSAAGKENDKNGKMLTCQLCNMKVSSELTLQKHVTTVHVVEKKKTPSVATQLAQQGKDDQKHKCPHCDFVCYRIQNFTRHLRGHEKPDFYKCDLCDYKHKNKGEVARHKRNAHAEKNHACPHCGSLHRNEVLLRTHIKLKHEWGHSVMCEICGKVLKTRFSYKKHKEIYHGNPKRKPGKVLCNICGRTLASQKIYRLHLEKCHSGENVTLEEKAIGEGFILNPDGKASCKFCKYQNNSAREVRRHILRLHVQKTLKCGRCDAAFLRESELLKHARVYHMELEKRKCDECNKTFLSEKYYQAHYNRIHADNKQYMCTFCKRQFYDKRSFIQHSELHKPEEERTWKYHCDRCQRKFRFKSNYDNHMLEHTGYRPFPCQICHKAFKTKNILDRHLVTHSDERPYTCKVCQKSFKLKKYLDIHLLSHTSDKFVCVFCGRIFVREEALNKHICRHVADKDGNPIRHETLEATQTSGEVTEQQEAVEGLAAGDQTTEKFVCTNCGECFAEETEVADHQCALSAGIVTFKDDLGNISSYCLTCNSEFETEEESNSHVCQVVTVESGMSTEIFNGTNVLESMFGGGATTIVVEQSGDGITQDTFEEVSLPTGENVQVMVDSDELRATLAQGGSLQAVHTTETLTDILGGDIGGPIHIETQYDPGHMGQGDIVEQEMEVVQQEEEESAASSQVYMCGICREIFSSTEEIHLHLQSHGDTTEVVENADMIDFQSKETEAVPMDAQAIETQSISMGTEAVVMETQGVIHPEQELLAVVMDDTFVEGMQNETIGTVSVE